MVNDKFEWLTRLHYVHFIKSNDTPEDENRSTVRFAYTVIIYKT